MVGEGFYGLYGGNGQRPLTVIPARLFKIEVIKDYFLNLNYRFRKLSQGELIDAILNIEVGIGCFALDGFNILIDEERRDIARDEVANLAFAAGTSIKIDPIGIVIRCNDND